MSAYVPVNAYKNIKKNVTAITTNITIRVFIFIIEPTVYGQTACYALLRICNRGICASVSV